MSGGLLLVADAISLIGDRADAATVQLKQTLAAQQAVNDDSTRTAGGNSKLGATTATNEGYGLPGEMIAALKLLEGRT